MVIDNLIAFINRTPIQSSLNEQPEKPCLGLSITHTYIHTSPVWNPRHQGFCGHEQYIEEKIHVKDSWNSLA